VNNWRLDQGQYNQTCENDPKQGVVITIENFFDKMAMLLDVKLKVGK
jgi:hypothetical protein